MLPCQWVVAKVTARGVLPKNGAKNRLLRIPPLPPINATKVDQENYIGHIVARNDAKFPAEGALVDDAVDAGTWRFWTGLVRSA